MSSMLHKLEKKCKKLTNSAATSNDTGSQSLDDYYRSGPSPEPMDTRPSPPPKRSAPAAPAYRTPDAARNQYARNRSQSLCYQTASAPAGRTGTPSLQHSLSTEISPPGAAIVVPLGALPVDDESIRSAPQSRKTSAKEHSPPMAASGSGPQLSGRRGSLIKEVADTTLVSIGRHDALVVSIEDPDKSYATLLGTHSCHDAMPDSNKVVVLDTRLNLKRAFYSLLYNSTRTALLHRAKGENAGFCGVISITDLIHAVRRCHATNNEMGTEDAATRSGVPNSVETALANTSIEQWLAALDQDGISRPYTFVLAKWSLLKAAQVLLDRKLHRVPVVNGESGNPLYVLTPERLLQYIVVFGRKLPRPLFLDLPAHQLGIGVWQDIVKCYTDDSLWDTLERLCTMDVSGMPVLDRNTEKVVAIYSRFDAIGIAAHNQFDNLRNMSVADALEYKSGCSSVPLVTCTTTDPLHSLVSRLIDHSVHRVVITDTRGKLAGLVTALDLIEYLVLRPARLGEADEEMQPVMVGNRGLHCTESTSSVSTTVLTMDAIPEHDVVSHRSTDASN